MYHAPGWYACPAEQNLAETGINNEETYHYTTTLEESSRLLYLLKTPQTHRCYSSA